MLIAAGPLVLGLLWLLLKRTRFGVLVRAATQDREMVGALGVNQALLFTGTLFLGAFLAGLGGALQMPKAPANTGMDLAIIAESFVVTVVGGMGIGRRARSWPRSSSASCRPSASWSSRRSRSCSCSC